MNDLEVDSKFTSLISDDKDTKASTAIIKCLSETLKKLALVNDGETLLDIASLSHGNDTAVITDVEDTVLLEDWAQHVLDDNRGRRVGDERGLLMKLLGEQINTEITMLTSLGGGGDANHLARASLQDQEIANANVVARDGDGAWSHGAGVA